jgi:hypothetical protein
VPRAARLRSHPQYLIRVMPAKGGRFVLDVRLCSRDRWRPEPGFARREA